MYLDLSYLFNRIKFPRLLSTIFPSPPYTMNMPVFFFFLVYICTCKANFVWFFFCMNKSLLQHPWIIIRIPYNASPSTMFCFVGGKYFWLLALCLTWQSTRLISIYLYPWCSRNQKLVPVDQYISKDWKGNRRDEGQKQRLISNLFMCRRLPYSVHEWAKIGPEPIWLRLAARPARVGMVRGLLIPIHVDIELAL
jgi:hypothetical protein